MNQTLFTPSTATLSRDEFQRLSTFIQQNTGIKMPEVKLKMLESRLRKRLRFLNLNSYAEYCDYLFSNDGMEKELPYFYNSVTTNKTDFFREPKHFNYLINTALPDIIQTKQRERSNVIRFWSSACSRGHEPYTIAMVVCQFMDQYAMRTFDFSILSTDISQAALSVGLKGVYDEEEIDPVPEHFRKKFLLKSKDRSQKLIKMGKTIRHKVQFKWLNLMHNDYGIREKMDVIFCRNVIIYFNLETQIRLINHLCRHLVPGGYLFMGHAEVLDCQYFPLKLVNPTIYRKL